MTIEEIGKFHWFLYMVGCEEAFHKNRNSYRSDSYSDYIHKINPISAIDLAFFWEKTKEGDWFWRGIDHTWIRFIKSKTIDKDTLTNIKQQEQNINKF